MTALESEAAEVQRCFPQIYLYCHTQHERRASSQGRVSARDASILAHIDWDAEVGAGELALHLGITPPTLSAALDQLQALGYLTRARAEGDRRRVLLRLTAAGRRAVQAGSVLDSARLKALLSRLTKSERAAACKGLGLLAHAALALRKEALRPAPRSRR